METNLGGESFDYTNHVILAVFSGPLLQQEHSGSLTFGYTLLMTLAANPCQQFGSFGGLAQFQRSSCQVFGKDVVDLEVVCVYASEVRIPPAIGTG